MNLRKIVPNFLFYGSVIFYALIWVETFIIQFDQPSYSWDICRLFFGPSCNEISQLSLLAIAPFIGVHVIPISLIVVFYFVKRRFSNHKDI